MNWRGGMNRIVKNYFQFMSGLNNGMDDRTIQCHGDTGGRLGLK